MQRTIAWATTSRGASSARGSTSSMKRLHVLVAQIRPFAADRFADEEPARPGDVKHGRMELHELHVAQLGAGAIRGRHAVAGRDRRVGRLAIDLPAPPLARIVCLAQTSILPCFARQTRAPTQRPSCVSRSSVKVSSQSVTFGVCVRLRADGPHDLEAGRVAQGMHDAAMAVAAFARQGDLAFFLVEMRAPADQVIDLIGGFADDHLDDVGIAQAAAGVERVFDVVLEVVLGRHHAGDAALGPGAVAVLDAFFGDDEDIEIARGLECRAQPRDAGADDENIREKVRRPLGVELHEVAMRGHGVVV